MTMTEVGVLGLHLRGVAVGSESQARVVRASALRLPIVAAAVRVHRTVQEDGVDRVDPALDGLGEVALLDVPRNVAVRVGSVGPLELGHLRRELLGAHVGPQDSGPLPHRVGHNGHLVSERALRRLSRHVHATACRVVLPAVVGAAQPVLLVAAEEEVRPAVRASALDQPHPSAGVAEGDQALAQQRDAHRGPVGLGQIMLDHERNPEPPHERPHRGPTADTGETFVILNAQHGARLLESKPRDRSSGRDGRMLKEALGTVNERQFGGQA